MTRAYRRCRNRLWWRSTRYTEAACCTPRRRGPNEWLARGTAVAPADRHGPSRRWVQASGHTDAMSSSLHYRAPDQKPPETSELGPGG
jgi:hypothetical protein